MIHILTVHWKDPKWINIQKEYIMRHLHDQYLFYAFLNDLSEEYNKLFDYVSTEPIRDHATKLNILADLASFNAQSEDDVLVFIDGDAFPVREVSTFVQSKLEMFPLVAIQRLENNGDVQPHPSFCATTVKFWRSIRGDWKSGYCWKNQDGIDVTDVGGNLLRNLRGKGVEWYPLLRSNTVNVHPLWFGLYGGIIYHHGAGFRDPVCRCDMSLSRKAFHRVIPQSLLCRLRKNKRIRRMYRKVSVASSVKSLSEEIYQSIIHDDTFFTRFEKVG